MLFEKIIGFRKLLIGLCALGVGYFCDDKHTTLVMAVYGCFCIANMAEHLFSKKTVSSPTADPALGEGVKKVLDLQETQIQALNFIVGFIRQTQGQRPPS